METAPRIVSKGHKLKSGGFLVLTSRCFNDSFHPPGRDHPTLNSLCTCLLMASFPMKVGVNFKCLPVNNHNSWELDRAQAGFEMAVSFLA